MWAGGHQQPSANAQQWWPMSYNYQYQTQAADTSQDWAAKAAIWAQQRMAQEQMVQYYQQQPQPQVDHAQLHQQPTFGGYQPDAQVNMGQQPVAAVDSQHFHPEVDVPPLPPEEPGEPPVPGWQGEEGDHVSDNIETVAMDDKAKQSQTAEAEADGDPSQVEKLEDGERQVTITQDYNHQPPPALPGMQTFDHNHGFNRPPPQQYSHVAPQPIDYGHGHHSLDYGHQGPLVPGAQVYDYQPQFDSHYYHQRPYEMERHHRLAHEHGKPKSHPPVDSDLSGLNDVKKKALPMWIREGLEKLEKKKQKKQDQAEEEEPKKLNLNLSGSASSIAGYDHGKVDSPVHSPKSNETDEESDTEKGGHQSAGEESEHGAENKSSPVREHLSWKAPKQNRKAESSDEEEEEEEEEGKTEEEKQQELVLNIRKLLTEVLLTVTNEEVKTIAQETYNEALRGPARQLQHSGGLDALRGKGGYLGLGGYGSDSESESEKESGNEKPYTDQEEREHFSADRDDRQHARRSRSRSHPGREEYKRRAEQDSEDGKGEKRSKRRDSGEKYSKKEMRQHRSPSSSVSDSSSSVSAAHHKSQRKKHRRRERSDSSSPKQRRRHRRRHEKKSRSRSRSPRKHSSSKKKRKSVSESDSDGDSRTSNRHKSSKRSREHSEKKHRRKRRSSSSSSYERDGKRDRKRKA